jgi:hypothetical protein
VSDPAAAFAAISRRLLQEPGVSEGTGLAAASEWPALASEALAFVRR